jgi:alpha-glucoside transport system substrate-binding protein
MAQSGFLSTLKAANIETYGNDTLKKEGQILLQATTFRFDGSDLMPGAVGAGSFWTGMVDFVGGKSAQDVADAIQKSWDAIK